MKTIRPSHRLAVAGSLAVFGFVSGVRAEEAEIELDQVPKAVMEAAKVKFPGAKIKEASKETEGGKTVFELEMTHEERNMDVTFQEDGTLVLVETQVPEKDVPSAVLTAVKDKYPGEDQPRRIGKERARGEEGGRLLRVPPDDGRQEIRRG